jgi:hypothetical protein
MTAPPILVANGEHELPLLEQDAVDVAQRFTGVIGIRSLGGRSIQLENRNSFSHPNQTEADVVPANKLSALVLQEFLATGSGNSWKFLPGGLDFAAVDFIHSQILAARNQGVAILLICKDLDELLALSDRVIVMTGGKVV